MKDQVIVITGASGGIGAALARRAAGEGSRPVLVARREGELERERAQCGGDSFSVAADVTKREDVRRIVQTVLDRAGRIDVWVNNVGRGISRKPSELTDEDIDSMVTVNVKSCLYGMQEVLPHFKERGAGHIINVSSMLGRIPFVVERAAYTAAKHFLNALTANFRGEISATHPNIKVSLISPGVVRTEFGVNALHGGPDSRMFPESQSAEEVAEVIAGVIASGRPDVYTRAGARDRVVGYYSSIGEDP